MGRAVGQNQLFCMLLNIGSLDFFDILHEVRDKGLLEFSMGSILVNLFVLFLIALIFLNLGVQCYCILVLIKLVHRVGKKFLTPPPI